MTVLKRRGWLAGLAAVAAVGGTTLVGGPAAAKTTTLICPRVVSVDNVTAEEGNPTEGPTTTRFVFRVTSSGCLQAGTARYETVSAWAQAPSDFATTSGTLKFAEGEGRDKAIVVDVAIDTVKERDDFFYVIVCRESGALEPGDELGVGTILNDDV